jgi:hypothetical protein
MSRSDWADGILMAIFLILLVAIVVFVFPLVFGSGYVAPGALG